MAEKKIVKVDADHVAVIRETKNLFHKTDLENRKGNLQAQLAEVEELLAEFTA